jgi:predicted RNA binding protein YcfA (HicA-like mRNA interferase family)
MMGQSLEAQAIHTNGDLTFPNTPDSYILIHMDSRSVIRALEADGWKEVAQKGSHKQFKHPTKPGRVTLPHPTKDIPIGTLRSIEKQSGLKLK